MPSSNENDSDPYPSCEIIERQEAEMEFVSVAYSNDEAWVSSSLTTIPSTTPQHENEVQLSSRRMLKQNRIHRRLKLHFSHQLLDDDDINNFNSNFNGNANDDSKHIPVELVLTMPQGYPIDPKSKLDIQAMIQSSSSSKSTPTSNSKNTTNSTTSISNHVSARKIALDALPHLIQACTEIASDEYIEEAVLAVLTRADDWVDTEWNDFVSQHFEKIKLTMKKKSVTINHHQQQQQQQEHICNGFNNLLKNQKQPQNDNITITISRKLIFSHHIIAKSKRKALKDLSRLYKLSGYAKIGWPGIIIIEGLEHDCLQFINEIKMMRWQHLEVRGEEQEERVVEAQMAMEHDNDEVLHSLRKFPLPFEELDEDQMSHLAQICRTAGLENLFLTSMKIHKENGSSNSTKSDHISGQQQMQNSLNEPSIHTNQNNKNLEKEFYGVLIRIDHMNDEKGYQKWIQKACKAAGCHFFLYRCYKYLKNDDYHNRIHKDDNSKDTQKKKKGRPIIIVGIWCHSSNSYAVKQVLKRWRTSRVDVDSRGNPCLERMMTILVEGLLELENHEDVNTTSTTCATPSLLHSNQGHVTDIDVEKMRQILKSMGGHKWEDAFLDVI